MAAKQGITAHISQASEDAKRALISHAPNSIKSHSWLSNLNTTCTIKSAPPRTPEVMAMLAVKSGWLVKRNEQRVWQRRYCCVVPHTFLYYFEAEPGWESASGGGGDYGYYGGEDGERMEGGLDAGNGGGDDGFSNTREGFSGGGINPNYVAEMEAQRPVSTLVENQDALNAAVSEGCANRDARHTPIKGGNNDEGGGGDTYPYAPTTPSVRSNVLSGPIATNANLSPVGIIDLECYTNIHRSTYDECVFELTGDAVTNPDLRSFYFQAGSIEDTEKWTKALLSDRHSALRDEREAYKQVCDSFQLQLQSLSDMIDEAEARASKAEGELYKVRSVSEKSRKAVVEVVREALEYKAWNVDTSHITSPSNHNNTSDETSSIANESTCASSTVGASKTLENIRLDSLDRLESILLSHNNQTASNSNPSNTTKHIQSTSEDAVTTLVDYLNSIIASHSDLTEEILHSQRQLSHSAKNEKNENTHLKENIARQQEQIRQLTSEHEEEKKEMQDRLSDANQSIEDTNETLRAQRMEFTMFQNSARSKLQELNKHKKILKREVIELRKKLDEMGSERDAALHKMENIQVKIQAQIDKNKLLNQFIAKLEGQVSSQQNFMDMVSHSGLSQAGGSFAGSAAGNIIGQNEDVKGMIVGPGASHAQNNEANDNDNNNATNTNNKQKSNNPLLPPSHNHTAKSLRNQNHNNTSKTSSVEEHTSDKNDAIHDSAHKQGNEEDAIALSERKDKMQKEKLVVTKLDTKIANLQNSNVYDHDITSPLSQPSTGGPTQFKFASPKVEYLPRSGGGVTINKGNHHKNKKDRTKLPPPSSSSNLNNSHDINNDIVIPPLTSSDEALSSSTHVRKNESNMQRLDRYQRSLTNKLGIYGNINNDEDDKPPPPPPPDDQDSPNNEEKKNKEPGVSDATSKHTPPEENSKTDKKVDDMSSVDVKKMRQIINEINDEYDSNYGTNDMMEDDQKSHISELTEDRTHRAMMDFIPPHSRNELSNKNSEDYEDADVDEDVDVGPYMDSDATQTRGRDRNHPPKYIGGDSALHVEQTSHKPPSVLMPQKNGGGKKHISSLLPPAKPPSQQNNLTSSHKDKKMEPKYSRDDVSLAMRSVDTLGSTGMGGGNGKLSVAQRARIEAESKPTRAIAVAIPQDVKTKLDERGNENKETKTGMGAAGLFSTLGNKLFDAIDNSSLGVGDSSIITDSRSVAASIASVDQTDGTGGDGDSYVNGEKDLGSRGALNDDKDHSKSNMDKNDTCILSNTKDLPRNLPKSTAKVNEAPQKKLTIAERQKLQRERQLEVLRKKGIIHDNEDVKGGAGLNSSPNTGDGNGSVTSWGSGFFGVGNK
eukprot:CAMPEP_0184873114 /NCGR_PEP_ID=MMETSP0580-20130426/41660_1 /TAXON_ID=1118495 /ORGANISM="Dactyliosolen fragilissimus" /LENGTH=1342 /DNA_ID=CAMNT_0027375979 /DNA_START=171 /DNA_END=4199 /DNA_ORIENTATION=+